MTKDLKKLAANGYGHWIRGSIPIIKRDIARYKADIHESQLRMNNLNHILEISERDLEKAEAELKEINEKYSHLEPEKEVNND